MNFAGRTDGIKEGLGYSFVDESLLELALTHRSYCAEHPNTESNERLEFLGDSVLGLVVTSHIYDAYSNLPEGQLAKLRASVVNTATLAELGVEFGIGPYLRLGKGEDQSGGRSKESILADAFEAIIGAIYQDAGFDITQDVILGLLGSVIAEGAEHPGRKDYKTQLQELTARLSMGSPTYEITGSGPDHNRTFDAISLIDGRVFGEGTGTSKKRAEQVAARKAYVAVMTEAATDKD